ncbi:DUF1492 domain-containing protein [Candidatus Clostridium stratigraminis]|uniref:DUF1492 domain-containing protein n=1 Tax=Candidatus Clostridium stratigraminis TaxID=3381661 RepID=A0ABW8T1K4_9CLOT
MDKKELSQLHHIIKEIELLKVQINNINHETVTDSVKGSDPYFPYVGHTMIISGIEVKGHDKKVTRLKRKLQIRTDELMNKVAELNDYIASIEDSEIRQILTLRYIENLTWKQIADKMGTKGEGDTERKKHDRFLKVSYNS